MTYVTVCAIEFDMILG